MNQGIGLRGGFGLPIKFLAFSLSFFLLLGSVACSSQPVSTPVSSEIGPEWVEQKMNEMSLEEKVGQMFVVGFQETKEQKATVVNDHAKQLIEKYHVGGMILFDRNIEHPQQVAQLNNELQKRALSSGPAIPLFLSVDQEGGKVARIREGVTVFPGNMALGATRDLQLAYEAGKQMGFELRTLGFNLNFAPVVDVNNNPDNPVIGVRSFGEDPHLTADMANHMIQGFHEAQVLTAIKHFPGHGDTSVDSHIDLPQVPHGRQRLDQIELVPFKKVIKQDADMVMTSHITFPAIEPAPGLPATLSRRVLTDLLREELGYQGVIITDDMEMGAIDNHFGTEEATVRAIQAGADLILIGHSLAKQEKALGAVKQAVNEGVISEQRIDESVRRVLQLKAKRLGDQSVVAEPYSNTKEMKQKLEKLAAQTSAATIAEKAVTLVGDKQNLLPLDPGKHRRLVVYTATKPQIFTRALDKAGFESSAVSIDELTKEQIPELLSETDQADAVIVGTSRLQSDSEQAELIRQLKTRQKPVIVVGMDAPYDVQVLPEGTPYLALYSSTNVSLEAGAKAIAGKIPMDGRLPVSVSSIYPFGYGASFEDK